VGVALVIACPFGSVGMSTHTGAVQRTRIDRTTERVRRTRHHRPTDMAQRHARAQAERPATARTLVAMRRRVGAEYVAGLIPERRTGDLTLVNSDAATLLNGAGSETAQPQEQAYGKLSAASPRGSVRDA
jgi:hypothetical protein